MTTRETDAVHPHVAEAEHCGLIGSEWASRGLSRCSEATPEMLYAKPQPQSPEAQHAKREEPDSQHRGCHHDINSKRPEVRHLHCSR